MGTFQTRTTDEVELQYAGLTGQLAAVDYDTARAEELSGVQAVLAWILHRSVEAPITLDAAAPTFETIEREFIAAGEASLDKASPAYRYALGAYEALSWLAGLRQHPVRGMAPASR